MKITSILYNTLASGALVGSGSVSNYISDTARRAMGMGLAQFKDGQVHYFSKDTQILKRAIKQRTHQLAYGMLRSYPQYLKYYEKVNRDKYLLQNSNTNLKNENGQYHQLIKDQKAEAAKKSYTDSVVGKQIVHDYLELSIEPNGSYYDNTTHTIESNQTYGIVTFVDLQPVVAVSSKNNLVLTTVQGRDYSRKEYISGGDLEITVTGKITSKYPDVYPEAEVSKFIRLMNYKGILNCDNTILRQFNINQLIVQDYSLQQGEYRNIQPYTLKCVAIEPAEAVEVKLAEQEVADVAIKHANQWIKIVRLGTRVIEPTDLLKISRLWI